MLFDNVNIEAVAYELPPNIISSVQTEEQLSPVYNKLRLPYGRLELMTGIKERRFWHPRTRPSTVAALAGKKALEQAGIETEQVDCLIHASVCRDFLEPATASVVHHHLKLADTCAIFDLSNACLGVLSGMMQIAAMIQAGQIEVGLIVSGECAEPLYNATIKAILHDQNLTRSGFKLHFASLTIGSGAVGVVLTKDDISKTTHRFLGGALLTDSRANELCQENTNQQSDHGPLMATDSEALLHAGCNLAARCWDAAKSELNWENDTPQHFFTHQVGNAHRKLLFERLSIELAKDFPTVSYLGNTGSAALPMAFALGIEQKTINQNDKIALLGIGSGLSSLSLGVQW
jgi:3-oxoacyl-[acyl-carrier-protein] synthase-3